MCSGADAGLTLDGRDEAPRTGLVLVHRASAAACAAFDAAAPDESAAHCRDGQFAVRLGLRRSPAGQPSVKRIVAARESGGPFQRDLRDLVRRNERDRGAG
ncbi:MAG: hypothetical protein R2692_06745 [Microbacterium sp.]